MDRKEKIKILHIGNLKGGVDICIRNILTFLPTDFEFVVVNGADDRNKPYIKNGHEVPSYKISMFRPINLLNDIKALIQAVRILKKERPDLVHCHSAKGGVIGRLAAFMTGCKSVYTPHAFSFLSSENKCNKMIYRLIEKIAKLNSYLIGCSDSERLLGIQQVGYLEQKTFAWTNSIPDIEVDQVKRPKGIVSDEKYIVTIARPCYQKNPMLMVETMYLLHKQFPDVRLYVLGADFYSPLLEAMKQRIEVRGLKDTIKVLPWISHDEAMGYLKYAQLYLSTSVYEGLPIAVLEAMALGKTVVASDVIGNRDCVKDSFNGRLLPLDAKMFAAECGRLLADEDERHRMGKNARTLFESDFLIDNRIGYLERIYQQVI